MLKITKTQFFFILIRVKPALIFDLLNPLIVYFFFKEQCDTRKCSESY